MVSGGGELLVPWPEAMGLIIQLPPLPGWGKDKEGEETTRPTGRILMRPPSFCLVYDTASSGSSVVSPGGVLEDEKKGS